jgi:membrane fusion protein, heavy metal efflux system
MTRIDADQPVSVPKPVQPPKQEARTRSGSKRERLSLVIQLVLSLAIIGGVIVYLLRSWGNPDSRTEEQRPAPAKEVVEVVGPKLIRVRPGTPLDEKLQIASVEARWITAPVLPVTGTTLASLRPGKDQSDDLWQFATPELLTAFSDWQKARVDIQFQEKQLKAIIRLNEAKVQAQQEVVARMKKLVSEAGTETEKSLIAEKVNLTQYEIEKDKAIHEQETAVKLAKRTEATLARQLQQAGLEPTLLRSAAAEGEIMVAEVPERAIGRVKLGMTCEVRFYGLPDRVFTGKVSSMSPVISKEKRVLNVQFTVSDTQNLIRPGMFAQIGLGTDKRQALLMPSDGLLHVGEKDYALIADTPGTWQIAAVQIGELVGTNVDVLSGLKAGDRVLGHGAILLKPAVVRALQSPAQPLSSASLSDNPGGNNK